MIRRTTGSSIALLALALVPGAGHAQAVLVGRTISDSSRDPISGAQVVVEKLRRETQSDADGRFTLASLDWGVHDVLIRKVGYRPVKLQLMVASNDTVRVDVKLRTSAVELPPLEVTASTVPPGMEDFARRRLAGWGTFFDSKQLRQNEARRLSDMLFGVRGVRTVSRGFRTYLVSTRSNCPMAVWLDGVQIYGAGLRRPVPDINDFSISQLDGVEVYSGPAETPAELAGRGSCGAVALWTRRG
jgi:hypothetical protein